MDAHLPRPRCGDSRRGRAPLVQPQAAADDRRLAAENRRRDAYGPLDGRDALRLWSETLRRFRTQMQLAAYAVPRIRSPWLVVASGPRYRLHPARWHDVRRIPARGDDRRGPTRRAAIRSLPIASHAEPTDPPPMMRNVGMSLRRRCLLGPGDLTISAEGLGVPSAKSRGNSIADEVVEVTHHRPTPTFDASMIPIPRNGVPSWVGTAVQPVAAPVTSTSKLRGAATCIGA